MDLAPRFVVEVSTGVEPCVGALEDTTGAGGRTTEEEGLGLVALTLGENTGMGFLFTETSGGPLYRALIFMIRKK